MRFEHNYKNVKITVSVGDIIRQQIVAIINPANRLLIMGGGVAGAIRHVGRREIENEALRKRSTKTRANPPSEGNRNLDWRPESKIRHLRPDKEETSNDCRKKTTSALPQMERKSAQKNQKSEASLFQGQVKVSEASVLKKSL